MFGKLGTALLCLFIFQADECGSSKSDASGSKASETQVASAASPGAKDASLASERAESAPAFNACSLIESGEVEAMQGAKVQGSAPSDLIDGDFAVSQCYYTVISSDGTKNLSVHLEVRENDSKSANKNALNDLWRERFQQAKEKRKTEKPKPVAGVGDEAFWVGNNKMGALYVRRKERILRVSVGGPDDEVTKLDKSKLLASKAVERLK